MGSRDEWIEQKRQSSVQRYNEVYSIDYDEKWGRIDNTHKDFIQLVCYTVPNQGKILDAACGTGKYWPLLLEEELRILGTDHSQGMLNKAKEKYPDIETHNIALQDIEFSEEFDGIICVDAMENIFEEHWLKVLDNFNRSLNQKGILYFTVEIEEEKVLEDAYQRALNMGIPVASGEVAVDGYHYYPNKNKVEEWLNQAGFEILKEEDGDGYVHFLCQKISKEDYNG